MEDGLTYLDYMMANFIDIWAGWRIAIFFMLIQRQYRSYKHTHIQTHKRFFNTYIFLMSLYLLALCYPVVPKLRLKLTIAVLCACPSYESSRQIRIPYILHSPLYRTCYRRRYGSAG